MNHFFSSTTTQIQLVPEHKTVTILGSTGTIGQNTLKLIASAPESFSVYGLTAHKNVQLLAEQAKKFQAKIAVIEDKNLLNELKEALQGSNVEAASGADAITEIAGEKVDIVISGIVGAAALSPTLAAIKQGTTIGLANKECLVCAGDIIMKKAQEHNASLIPVDSEHNSLFQCFDFGRHNSIEKITLTASGGPFRGKKRNELQNITPEQAVKHPNWSMGAKISVDSATLMNKGLEVIEAWHLFPIAIDDIDVVVHPQSIIHGLVHYDDGSVLAGLSIPDMCVPLAYALGWPNRMPTKTPRLDLASIGSLTFEQPDVTTFPALTLAEHALRQGGTTPASLNAANEIAVEAFLNKKISFLQITNVVEDTLESVGTHATSSLEDVVQADANARRTAAEVVSRVLG